MTVTNPGSTTTNKVLGHPLNAWYVVAWDHEVTRRPMSRRVAGRPLALYRREDGKAVALADACWHRLAPLSMGKTVGKDGIQCPYHGIVYNSAGRCISMPAQETLNPSATVPSFPVIERHRFVWVWLGDSAKANPDLVPDMHWADDPAWAGDGGTIHAPCNYQLVLDNLMDLTHEEFVHEGSIGNDALSQAGFDVTHGENTVTLTRWMTDIEAPPVWAAYLRERFPDYVGRVDRWQIITFQSPSTICLDVGVAKAGTGAPQGDRSQGVNGYVLNTVSPETAKSCHYFWAFMRNFETGSQRLTTQTREGVAKIFAQDEEMLRAQQEAIDANPDYEFYNLNIDAGGMWVRRLIERQLAAEGRLLGAV
ncbi:aromatic ring-hydroxylating dioxygenase subunit alpha [Pseudarthrobacter oxydans]|uniref:aromatic ring-hydroxylating dioxygenase subunit alpha n=1 Tax=Pseudarthrobacter oxydans TaxID=1671 RepID=UPI00380B9476